MGRKLNVTVLVVTIVVALSTTALMCLSILTDYWEIVTYPLTNIEKIVNASSTSSQNNNDNNGGDNDDVYTVETLLKGKVILIQKGKDTKEIMIQMNAGLWAICYDVTGGGYY